MWDFSLRESISLLRRTMPFLLLRCGVYFGITLAYIVMTGVGAGVGYGIGGFSDDDFRTAATMWGGFIGFGLVGGVVFFLREYLLYTVKAGHIAVMVQLMDGKELPEGRSQLSYGGHVVKTRFAQTNMLFAMDLLIKGVINAVTGLIQGIGSLLPIPGLQSVMGAVRAFLRIAVGLVDEIILAYIIRTDSDNPWLSARSALVLYGQNAKVMMKNAAWLTLFTYGLSLLVFLVMLAPAAAFVYMIPGAWSAGGFVFALLFAWAVKVAVIEPLAIACLMQAYFKTIEAQEPNPEWEARLDKASGKFKELKDKAVTWVSPKPTEPSAADNAQ